MRRSFASSAAALLLLSIAAAAWGSESADSAKGAIARAGACPESAAEQAVQSSGFARHAERLWERRFGRAEFAVSRTVCGHLAGRRGRDMVVVLGLSGGTGSSPKPWAIFNRTRRGLFRLRHEDLGRRLICPQGVGIHRRVLSIYRPTEYWGAYTICDQVARFRWKHGHYEQISIRPAFERCRSPQVIPPSGGGYGLIVRDLRVAGMSCRRGAGVISQMPPRWHCNPVDDEARCQLEGNWRKWLTYVSEGSAG